MLRFTQDAETSREWDAYSDGLLVARILYENDRIEASEREWSWHTHDIVQAEPEVMAGAGLRTFWMRRMQP